MEKHPEVSRQADGGPSDDPSIQSAPGALSREEDLDETSNAYSTPRFARERPAGGSVGSR